jgi:hypothetical protein
MALIVAIKATTHDTEKSSDISKQHVTFFVKKYRRLLKRMYADILGIAIHPR